MNFFRVGKIKMSLHLSLEPFWNREVYDITEEGQELTEETQVAIDKNRKFLKKYVGISRHLQ